MDSEIIFPILNHASSLSILLPLCFCLLKLKTLNKELRVLFIYLIASAVTDLLGFIFISKNIKTYLLYDIFALVECSLLTLIFYKKFERRLTRITVLILYFIFLILFLKVFPKSVSAENIYLTYEAGLLIFFSVGYIIKVMIEMNVERMKEKYFNWITVGILIYFSAAFFPFLFKLYIVMRGLETYNDVYSFHWIGNIALNTFIAIGLWKKK
jgi:hypothetical protein